MVMTAPWEREARETSRIKPEQRPGRDLIVNNAKRNNSWFPERAYDDKMSKWNKSEKDRRFFEGKAYRNNYNKFADAALTKRKNAMEEVAQVGGRGASSRATGGKQSIGGLTDKQKVDAILKMGGLYQDAERDRPDGNKGPFTPRDKWITKNYPQVEGMVSGGDTGGDMAEYIMAMAEDQEPFLDKSGKSTFGRANPDSANYDKSYNPWSTIQKQPTSPTVKPSPKIRTENAPVPGGVNAVDIDKADVRKWITPKTQNPDLSKKPTDTKRTADELVNFEDFGGMVKEPWYNKSVDLGSVVGGGFNAARNILNKAPGAAESISRYPADLGNATLNAGKTAVNYIKKPINRLASDYGKNKKRKAQRKQLVVSR